MKRRESHGSRRVAEIKSPANRTATSASRRKRAALPISVSDRLALADIEAQIRTVVEATSLATTHLDVKRGELKLKGLRAMMELIDRRERGEEVRDLQAQLATINTALAVRKGRAARAGQGAIEPRRAPRSSDGGAVVPRLRRPTDEEN